jgi:hypothetical protein
MRGPVLQTRRAHQFLANLKMLAKTCDRLTGAKEARSTVFLALSKGLSAVGFSSQAAIAWRRAECPSPRRDLLQRHTLPVCRPHREVSLSRYA